MLKSRLSATPEKNPEFITSFDLEDEDKILRIVSTERINGVEIELLLKDIGVYCERFPD